MANTYTISLPDRLKPFADKLATERKLSELITDLLDGAKERQDRKEKGIRKIRKPTTEE
jgi:hypothetical protein